MENTDTLCDYVIYRIDCLDKNITEFYIGSTKNIENRIWGHRKSCENENDKSHHLKVYSKIRENGGFDNWIFSTLKTLHQVSRQQSLMEEQNCIDEFKPSLNVGTPYATVKSKQDMNKKKNWRQIYFINKHRRLKKSIL